MVYLSEININLQKKKFYVIIHTVPNAKFGQNMKGWTNNMKYICGETPNSFDYKVERTGQKGELKVTGPRVSTGQAKVKIPQQGQQTFEETLKSVLRGCQVDGCFRVWITDGAAQEINDFVSDNRRNCVKPDKFKGLA